MPIAELTIFKLITPFQKLFFACGGWLAGLIMLLLKPEKIEKNILLFRGVSSFIAIPITMGIDSVHAMNKWLVCCTAVGIAYFGWLVMSIIEKRLPKMVGKKLDEIEDLTK